MSGIEKGLIKNKLFAPVCYEVISGIMEYAADVAEGLAHELVGREKKKMFVLHAIPKGGIIPAGMFDYFMTKKGYLCATCGEAVEIVGEYNKIDVVIDDIIDSGKTMLEKLSFIPTPINSFIFIIPCFLRSTKALDAIENGRVLSEFGETYIIYKEESVLKDKKWIVFPWEESWGRLTRP